MSILMPMYTAQWEWKLVREGERQANAEQDRLAQLRWSASEASKPKEGSRTEKPTLRRLLISLGHAGA